MRERPRTRRQNPVARAVKRLRPKAVRPKRGKGSYRRKDRRPRPAASPVGEEGPAGQS